MAPNDDPKDPKPPVVGAGAGVPNKLGAGAGVLEAPNPKPPVEGAGAGAPNAGAGAGAPKVCTVLFPQVTPDIVIEALGFRLSFA